MSRYNIMHPTAAVSVVELAKTSVQLVGQVMQHQHNRAQLQLQHAQMIEQSKHIQAKITADLQRDLAKINGISNAHQLVTATLQQAIDGLTAAQADCQQQFTMISQLMGQVAAQPELIGFIQHLWQSTHAAQMALAQQRDALRQELMLAQRGLFDALSFNRLSNGDDDLVDVFGFEG